MRSSYTRKTQRLFAGIEKKSLETLNPLEVFVDSSCRVRDAALGCFDPLSLVHNVNELKGS